MKTPMKRYTKAQVQAAVERNELELQKLTLADGMAVAKTGITRTFFADEVKAAGIDPGALAHRLNRGILEFRQAAKKGGSEAAWQKADPFDGATEEAWIVRTAIRDLILVKVAREGSTAMVPEPESIVTGAPSIGTEAVPALDLTGVSASGRNVFQVPIEDTKIHTWFERDRAHVELRHGPTEKTIVQWWDDEVQSAIEDGFITPGRGPRPSDKAYHTSAYEYASSIGLLDADRFYKGCTVEVFVTREAIAEFVAAEDPRGPIPGSAPNFPLGNGEPTKKLPTQADVVRFMGVFEASLKEELAGAKVAVRLADGGANTSLAHALSPEGRNIDGLAEKIFAILDRDREDVDAWAGRGEMDFKGVPTNWLLESVGKNAYVNLEQKVYVTREGGGFSCLGFEVCERKTRGVFDWLGKPEAAEGAEAHGTAKAWGLYSQAMAEGAAYSQQTGKRCEIELEPQLKGLEGRRVEVEDRFGNTRRFQVGKSTGWMPCHLEIHSRRSSGGPMAMGPYKSVTVVR